MVRTIDATKTGIVPAVRPGDVVTVPTVDPAAYVFVAGGVKKGDPTPFREGMTLLDALREAQPVEGAAVDQIRVLRNSNGGTVETYNLAELLADSGAPVALRAGDRVEVPYARMQSKSDRELLVIVVIGLLLILLLK
jgi:protein involved in polysaccharide export with SLBB domain